MTWKRTGSWAVGLLALAAGALQAAKPLPPSIPADVTFTDAKTGQDTTLSGELVFESWPIAGKDGPDAIGKGDLMPTQPDTIVFQRAAAQAFTIRTFRGERTVQFAFDRIPVRVAEDEVIGAALEGGFREENDAAELLSGEKKTVAPAPVVLALRDRPPLDVIEVARIKRIAFKLPPGVAPVDARGRFVGFSKAATGSGGAVQVTAATFFGGPDAERFVAADFLPDGTIVAVANVTGLAFAGAVPQVVMGPDAPLPQSQPAAVADAPAGKKAAAPRDPRQTAVLVQYSADLKQLSGLIRFPWGAGTIDRLRTAPNGALYISGQAGVNFEKLQAAAGKAQVIEPAEIRPKTPTPEGAYLARLAPDGKRLEWLIFFRLRNINFGFSTQGRLLVSSHKTYWLVGPDGDVSPGPVLNPEVGGTLHVPLTVSPLDGSFYLGGEYHSGTGREPYRNPFLHKFSANGQCAWTAWNWTGPVVGVDQFRQVSDSAVRLVRVDRQGNPIVYGWSDGGNTVFTNEPYDLQASHGFNGFASSMWGAGVLSAAHLLRLDAQTMKVTAYTALLSFLPTEDKPNSMSVRDLLELPDGRVVVTGGSAYGLIETADAWVESWLAAHQKDPRSAKVKGGPFFAVHSADFNSLLFRSVVPGLKDQALAARGSQVLLFGAAAPVEQAYGLEAPALLASPVQKDFGGGATDAYLMLINTGDAK